MNLSRFSIVITSNEVLYVAENVLDSLALDLGFHLISNA